MITASFFFEEVIRSTLSRIEQKENGQHSAFIPIHFTLAQNVIEYGKEKDS